MARPASTAVAGFYPTPTSVTPLIASYLRAGERAGRMPLVDPCAGEGVAIAAIKDALGGGDVYACEMERERFNALRERFASSSWGSEFLHGDAFLVDCDRLRAALLYLNPPYEPDREFGRLEEKFLWRFGRVLVSDAPLVFVVPHYALSASAATLGREYHRLWCARFPGESFDAFKQVVLFAERAPAPLADPDPAIVAQVEQWAADPLSMPELGDAGPTYVVQAPVNTGYVSNPWTMQEIDVVGLLGKLRPWHESTRGRGLVQVESVMPAGPADELLARSYAVAVPPRPAHIAAGMASGLFNGARVEPRAGAALPPLLIKGVFDREWRTIEEKTNKDGDKTGEVQVQQPKLVVTVLDLEARRFYTLREGAERTNAPSVGGMAIADVLNHYGDSLARVMERQCRIGYDPRSAEQWTLPASPRQPFTAQAHAVRAVVQLLGGPGGGVRGRGGQAAILLGEIGSGKSTVALLAGRAIGARCALVLCPPHLLESWRNETASVFPDARVVELASVTDVDALAADPSPGLVVALLSREVAKLGHALEGAGPVCPRCGSLVPEDGQARRRERCAHRDLKPANVFAGLARELALQIHPYAPNNARVELANLFGGHLRRWRAKWKRPAPDDKEREAGAFALARAWAERALDALLARYEERRDHESESAITGLLTACSSAMRDELVERAAAVAERVAKTSWSRFSRELVFLLPPGSERQQALRARLRDDKQPTYYGYGDEWRLIDAAIERAAAGEKDAERGVAEIRISWRRGELYAGDARAGSVDAALGALSRIVACAKWRREAECGEPLFQAVPRPRRFPLATYICRRHAHLFDYLIVDEGHEYATDGSAQERAAHRLMELGLPTVLQTGSIMNGYAESLFTNLWSISRPFREEFQRSDRGLFVDRYGYRKRLVEERDGEGKVVAFGSQSDRVERQERDAGNAPGVLPLLLFRHLLPFAVTLHKADLAADLPVCTQDPPALIKMLPEQEAEYRRLLAALLAQIKRDRFKEDLAGKLFGQLADFPSFVDRCTADVGNEEGGEYSIRYPESLDSRVVEKAESLPSTRLLPKEAWLLRFLEREVAAGRRAMIFGWHLDLLPRIAELVETWFDEPCPILWADKVPTGKRQAWIEREIVKKGRRFMVANPVAIQTGLNNLVHFSTEVWFENPACNPIVFRQAIGRVDRIGQKLPTRIAFPIYEGSLQRQLYDLLMAKVAVSTATDGLDPESALRAAGAGDDHLAGLSIGKQLYALLTQDGAE
jgi:hypothetical protein